MFQFIQPFGSVNPVFNSFTVNGDSFLDGAVTINDSGADEDFRVEAYGEANAFFLEGAQGNIGIGLNNPGSRRVRIFTDNAFNDVGLGINMERPSGTNYATSSIASGSGATTNIGGFFSASGASTNRAFWAYDGDVVLVTNSGSVGIGTTGPAAKLEIDGSATEGKHLLELDQDDNDEPFIKFDGTSAADQTKNISTVNGDGAVEGPKNYSSTAGWAFEGMIRIDVNGTDYWMPYYSADLS